MNTAALFLGWLVVGLVAGTFAQIYDDDRSAPGVARPVALGAIGSIGGGVLANLALAASVTSVGFPALVGSFVGAIGILRLRPPAQAWLRRRARRVAHVSPAPAPPDAR